MVEKREYERPVIIDYGSIADHTFGLSNGLDSFSPSRPDRPSF
jgi:hypothetical protein